jgi:hypothetical protein
MLLILVVLANHGKHSLNGLIYYSRNSLLKVTPTITALLTDQLSHIPSPHQRITNQYIGDEEKKRGISPLTWDRSFTSQWGAQAEFIRNFALDQFKALTDVCPELNVCHCRTHCLSLISFAFVVVV